MFVSVLLRGGAMTDERAKERERQDGARGRLCYVLLYVLHRDDSAPWWEATPFWGSKSPHESHGAQPFSLSLSLSRSTSYSRSLSSFSLPLGLGLSAWVSLFSLFVSPLSHVPVSEHYRLHGMCRRAMKCICHCFHIYTLFLPHAVFISHCVPTPSSVTRCAPASLLGLITSVDVLKNTSSGRSNKRHFREAHTLSLITWYLLV